MRTLWCACALALGLGACGGSSAPSGADGGGGPTGDGMSSGQDASTGDAAAPPHTGAARLAYSDLTVGSGTGGDTGNGVYVRLFGNGFGSTRGGSKLTLGGGDMVTSCALCTWSDTQIVAQVGGAATTGNIVLTVDGLASNGLPFTVAPTKIVFASASGNDSNAGTFAAPFKTWRAAFDSVTGNDNQAVTQNTVIYLEPGIDVSMDDGRGYRATISTDLGGTGATQQLAIVGYPGGTVNVGSTSIDNGVHGYGTWLTIADLTIVGGVSAIDAEAGNVRIVNNLLSCPAVPSGTGGSACLLGETQTASDTWAVLGNDVHDTGGNVDKTYHAVYFSSGVNHADVGWNTVGAGFKGYCRGIIFHATTGANNFDLHVHDNVIFNSYCDGLAFASVDASQGPVEAYNNLIYDVALATNPYGVANEAGIAVNTDPVGTTSGVVQIYNNTVVNAGAYATGNQNGCFGVVTAGATMNLTNNLCVQPGASQPYIEPGSTFTADHNVWFGAGPAPSEDAHAISSDPKLTSSTDFSLAAGSPAEGAGSTAHASTYDLVGNVRATPPSIGAYER